MTAFSNLLSATRIVLTCAAMLLACNAQADVRVLINFDESGHRVHRLVNVENTNPAFATTQPSQSDIEKSQGKVALFWIGANGATLLSASMDDPRLTHTPLTSADTGPTFVRLTEGAYLVSGPSNSTILEIRLPANNALALQAQTWQFKLIP